MKIRIEPSKPQPRYHTILADSLCDDELTDEAVEMVLDALVAYGHLTPNLIEAANKWCAEQKINICSQAEELKRNPDEE